MRLICRGRGSSDYWTPAKWQAQSKGLVCRSNQSPPLFRKFENSGWVILRKIFRLLVDVGWRLKPNVSPVTAGAEQRLWQMASESSSLRSRKVETRLLNYCVSQESSPGDRPHGLQLGNHWKILHQISCCLGLSNEAAPSTHPPKTANGFTSPNFI